MSDRLPMSSVLPSLPPVPGGWNTRTFQIGDRAFELWLPQQPDLLLDDPAVLAANQRDDYMPYWSFLWPAAEPFAHALTAAPWPAGSEVLDLGSGIGLSGLTLLARGDRVVFSDYDPQSLVLCRQNALRNGFAEPETLLLDWRRPIGRRFQFITGCEITYERRNHEPLLLLLQAMLAPDGRAWIADPGRFHAPAFYRQAIDAGFQVRILDNQLDVRDAPLSNEFQIMELRPG